MIVQGIYRTKLEKYRVLVDDRLRQAVTEEKNPRIRALLWAAVENGRRFRPLLFILTYKLLGQEPDACAYELAAAIEMLHKASLLHDDLIDGDDYRRGKPAFHRRYGPEKTIIVGDLLVALAGTRFQRFAGPELTGDWLELYRKLCYGEFLDVISGDEEVDRPFIEAMIYGKTAGFLEFILGTAAALCQAPPSQQHLLAAFGREIGFLFQYLNDWNNWSGRESAIGRPAGSDQAKGRVNLITLLQQEGMAPEAIEEHLRLVLAAHRQKAGQLLKSLGIKNKYTAFLGRLLNRRETDWYWTDPDG
ncbi:MAG: polyprenyl synthetase family protein [Firmicutes bacterium]|nr:polyprenyl synthetase family protein [Bacillota bacterium]